MLQRCLFDCLCENLEQWTTNSPFLKILCWNLLAVSDSTGLTGHIGGLTAGLSVWPPCAQRSDRFRVELNSTRRGISPHFLLKPEKLSLSHPLGRFITSCPDLLLRPTSWGFKVIFVFLLTSSLNPSNLFEFWLSHAQMLWNPRWGSVCQIRQG